MKFYLKYIFSFIFLLCSLFLSAQIQQSADSVEKVSLVKELAETSIEERIPSPSEFDKYREDKAFDYVEAKRPEYPEWVLDILNWFNRMLGETASVIFSRNVFIVAITVLIIALIVAIILRVQNINIRNLFGRRKLQEDVFIYDEDVNTMNFESLISEAVQKKNYRMAVRYLYLKNLKALSDKLIINWSPNKTNYIYLNEIRNENLKNNFWESTQIFDFVWYGEFILDEQSFSDAYNYFNEFNRMINNER